MSEQFINKNGLIEDEIIGQAVAIYGPEAQTDMMIEEMAELTQALLKYRRYGTPLRLEAVQEEMADVEIMLRQMRIIYGDTEAWKGAKLRRLEARLSGQTEETV